MELYQKKEECCGCGACEAVCPVQAVYMLRDEEGFAYPLVDDSSCIHCGRCEQVCPVKHPFEGECENRYLGAQAGKEEIRYSSTSGGVFSVLAEYVLGQGGVVYGAGFDDWMRVKHRSVSSLDDLDLIKRTKYVQSDMQGIYDSVLRDLKEERWVLFSGTPCQTHALKLFLDQAYERLILLDLVCYGVPSPGIWEDYVSYLERKHHGRMTAFSFRDKRARDDGHTCAYVIDGKEYAGSVYQDIFCRSYFTNHTLRPSCGSCHFCTVYRDSDLTIGDFWGIGDVRPDMNDGMGTSLVILHSDKAKKIWEQIQEKLNWFACGKEDVMQPRLTEAVKMAGKRGLFMKLYRSLPFPLSIKWMDIAGRL